MKYVFVVFNSEVSWLGDTPYCIVLFDFRRVNVESKSRKDDFLDLSQKYFTLDAFGNSCHNICYNNYYRPIDPY